ncbi:MAG: ABC transporter substrate-binding protein [Salinispira sp.]
MKRIIFVVCVNMLAFFQLSAGGGGEARPAEGAEEMSEAVAPGLRVINRDVGWERGRRGGEFILSDLGSGPKTFNTVLAEETSSSTITDYMLADALVERNQHTLEWEANLAESWTISDDQKSITFKIRNNLKWSDGEAITAHDWADAVNSVIYNDDIQSSAIDAYTVGGERAQWEALDDLTLRITVAEVYAGLLSIANTLPLPMHIIGPILDAEGAEGFNNLWGIDSDPTQIPSSGPYVVDEYIPNQRIVFTVNPNYHKRIGNTRLPYLERVTFLFTPDQDTQLQQFLTGTIDFYSLRGEDYAVLIDEKESLNFEIYEVGPSTSTNFITFNQNPDEDGPDNDGDVGISGPKLEWLSNLNFRQAMAHLIDRQTYINNIAFGFGYPQYSFVSRFSPYYWEDVDTAVITYDPIEAATILDRINYIDRDGDGWREDENGVKISLNLSTNSGNRVREDIGSAFAQEASNIGVEINFRPLDFNELVTQLVATYDWDMILIGFTGSVDPISGANVYPSYGNLHMIEPNQESPRRDWEVAVDAAWVEANETTDEAQRKSGFEKIQREWVENIPWAYTYNPLIMHAVDGAIGNVYTQPVTGYGIIGTIEYLYRK